MDNVRYARIYADPDGQSHFTDEEMPMVPVVYAPPAPPLDLSSFTRAEGIAFLGMPAGWSGDWHPSPHRQIFLCLSGEFEAQASDGEVRRLTPGSILLMEDTTGKGHLSRSIGGDALGAVVQLPDA